MSIPTTPANVDGFSRFFAAFFDENLILPQERGWLSLFAGRPIYVPDSTAIDIDIVRGNETTAPVIPRGNVGRALDIAMAQDGRFSNFSRIFPLTIDSTSLSAKQVYNRIAGEAPYSPMTVQSRMRELGARKYAQLVARTARTWEVLAMHAILEGKQPAVTLAANETIADVDDDLLIDFQRDLDLTKTYLAAGKWTVTTVDPYADLDDVWTTLRKTGHVSGDTIIFGADAIAAFKSNAKVTSGADNRRIPMYDETRPMDMPAKYQPMVDGGMIYMGEIVTHEHHRIYAFSYPGVYEADDNISKNLMPADSFLMFNFSSRRDRYFGPPDTLPLDRGRQQFMVDTFGISQGSTAPALSGPASIIEPQAMYVDAYPAGDYRVAQLRLQSAPIFAPIQTDAYFVGKSVA